MSVHVDRVRGTWLFIFDLPRAADRRRRQMMRRGFADEQKAAVAEEEARRHAGVDIPLPVAGSVAGELMRWLRDRELDIAVTSLATYRSIVRRYLIPDSATGSSSPWTGTRSTTCTGTCCTRQPHQRTALACHRPPGASRPDESPQRPRHRGPGVRQPRPADKPAHGRKGVWTAQQCGTFLTHTAGDRLHAAWTLAIVCGLRRGELAGLTWPKVDLDRGAIHVHWQRCCAPASSPAASWRRARRAPAGAPSRSAPPSSTS